MKRGIGTFIAVIALTTTAVTADDKGTTVEIGGLKSTAPAGWKKTEIPEKQKAFRAAQFRVPKAEGDKDDAEMVVSFFGKAGAGPVDANVKRWKDQFKAPAGDNAKSDKFKVGDAEVVWLDINGTYLFKPAPFDPNPKVEEKPDYRAINAIFPTPNGPYYFRLVGPAKTIEVNKKPFEDMVKGFK